MFYATFLSPQVKRCAVIIYKYCLYGLSHEFPNDLRLRILGNIRKVARFHRMMPRAYSSCKNESFVDTSRKLLTNRNETFRVVFYGPENET